MKFVQIFNGIRFCRAWHNAVTKQYQEEQHVIKASDGFQFAVARTNPTFLQQLVEPTPTQPAGVVVMR